MLDLCVILNTRYDYQILLWQVGGESLHVSPSQYTILAPSNSVLSEQWNVKIAPPAFCTAVPSYTELTSLGSHPGSVIYHQSYIWQGFPAKYFFAVGCLFTNLGALCVPDHCFTIRNYFC